MPHRACKLRPPLQQGSHAYLRDSAGPCAGTWLDRLQICSPARPPSPCLRLWRQREPERHRKVSRGKLTQVRCGTSTWTESSPSAKLYCIPKNPVATNQCLSSFPSEPAPRQAGLQQGSPVYVRGSAGACAGPWLDLFHICSPVWPTSPSTYMIMEGEISQGLLQIVPISYQEYPISHQLVATSHQLVPNSHQLVPISNQLVPNSYQ